MPAASLDAAAIAPLGLCLLIVAGSLLLRRPTRAWARRTTALAIGPVRALQALHSGIVNDYVAWWLLGVAGLTLFLGVKQ